MKTNKIFISVGILSILFQYSCSDANEKTHTKNSSLAASNSSNIYFTKSTKKIDINKKIRLLGRSLDTISNRSDTLLPILLNYKTFYHQQIEEYDSSMYFADSLVRVSQFQKDTVLQAQAFYRKSIIHRFQGNQIEEYKNAFKSYFLYKKINDSLNTAKRALEMAVIQSHLTDFEGSQASATEVIKYLSTAKDSVTISNAYNMIAIAYKKQGIYAAALEEYENALRFSTLKSDSLSYYHNIALVYKYDGQYDKAIALYKFCLKEVDTTYTSSQALYIENLAIARWTQNPSLNIEPELLRAHDIRLNAGLSRAIIISYGNLSSFYENRDAKKALEYATKYLEGSVINKRKVSELKALQKLTLLAPEEESKMYAKKYFSLNDSLNTASLSAKNSFAKIKFDEEQKQQEINNLEAETVSQQLETEQLENQLIILSLESLLVLSIGGFILYYFKQRHKKEKLQEVYNTETRISKTIHDELANDIYNMMGRLEPIATLDVLDNLASIYSRTRDISRANSEIDIGENYINHLLSILSNAAPANTKLIIKGENAINWKGLSAEKKILIYRILQELMVNMKKHSTASIVAIIFSRTENYLNIDYSDNGKGTELSSIKSGNGLKNVENRIFSVKGKINFETEIGKGFKTNLQIPL